MYIYYVSGLPFTGELYHYISGGTTFGRMDSNELWHYGIKGQSWGKRRFQNEDGSLTFAGRNRYDVGPAVGTGSATVTPPKAMPINKTSFASSNVGKSGSYSTGVSKPTATTSSAPKTTRTEIVRSKANAGKIAADNFLRNVSQGAGNIKSGVTQAATNAYNNVGQAASNAGNWVDARANEVGDAVSNAAQNIGRTATNALDDTKGALKNVGNWFGDRARDVGGAVSNAAGNVGNAANNALDSAKNWAGNAAKDVGNFVSNNDELERLNNVQAGRDKVLDAAVKRSGEYVPDGRGGEDLYIRNEADARAVNALDRQVDAAQRAYDNHPMTRAQNFADYAKKALESPWVNPVEAAKVAGDWIGDRAQDVGGYIGNTKEFRDASRAVNGAIDSTIDTGKNAAQKLGGFASGLFNGAKDAVTNAGNAVGDFARGQAENVGQAATNAFNGAKEFLTGADASKELNEAYSANRAAGGNGEDDANGNLDQRLANARAAEMKTLPGMANWLDENLRENVLNEIEGRANKIGQKIQNGARDAAQNVSDWYTGGNNAEKAERLDRQAQDLDKLAEIYGNRMNDDMVKLVTEVNQPRDRDNGMHDEIRRRAGEDLHDKWYQDAKTFLALKDKARDIDSQADSYQNTYNNSPRQRIQNGIGAVTAPISNAAQNVGNWLGDRAQDVGGAVSNAGNWLGDRASDVGGTVSNAAQGVSNFVSDKANDVKNWYTGEQYSRMANDYRNKASDRNDLADYYQNFADTNRVYANNIDRRQGSDSRPAHNSSADYRDAADEWEMYANNARDNANRASSSANRYQNAYDNSPRQVLSNADQKKGSNSSNSSQSSDNIMSDKPAGVSDEYWRDYKYNGGTRADWNKKQQSYMNSAGSSSKAATSAPVGTVDTSRPYHFTYDPNSGKTIVVYDDEKR